MLLDYGHDVVRLYPLCTLAAGIIQSQRGQRPFGQLWLFDSQSQSLNQVFYLRLLFVTCLCRRAGFPFSLRVSGNKHGAGDGGQNLRAYGEYSVVLRERFSGIF